MSDFNNEWQQQQGSLMLNSESDGIAWKRAVAEHFYKVGFLNKTKAKDEIIAELQLGLLETLATITSEHEAADFIEQTLDSVKNKLEGL